MTNCDFEKTMESFVAQEANAKHSVRARPRDPRFFREQSGHRRNPRPFGIAFRQYHVRIACGLNQTKHDLMTDEKRLHPPKNRVLAMIPTKVVAAISSVLADFADFHTKGSSPSHYKRNALSSSAFRGANI